MNSVAATKILPGVDKMYQTDQRSPYRTATPPSRRPASSSARILAIVGVVVVLTLIIGLAISLLSNKTNVNGIVATPTPVSTVPQPTWKTTANKIDWTTYLGSNGQDNTNIAWNSKEDVITPNTAAQLKLAGTFNVGKSVPYTDTIVTGILYKAGVLYFGAWDGYEYAIDAATYQMKWRVPTGTFMPLCDYPNLGISSNASLDANGILYVGGGNGKFYAMDTNNNGKVVWKTQLTKSTDEYLWGSPMVENNSVYMGVASIGDCPISHGRFYRFDPKTGQILATHLTTDDPNGGFGAEIWTKPSWDAATNSIILAMGNGSYVTSEGQSVVQLDPNTLTVMSKFQMPKSDEPSQDPMRQNSDFGSSCQIIPIVAGKDGAVCHNKSGYVFGLQITPTGLKLAWSIKLGLGGLAPEGDEADLGSSTFDGRYIYTGTAATMINGKKHTGAIYKLDPLNGKIVWTVALDDVTGDQLFSLAPLVGVGSPTDGLIAVGLTKIAPVANGALLLIRASDGKVLFDYSTTGAVYGAPLIVNGHLYATTVFGNVLDFAIIDKIPASDDFTQGLDAKQWKWVNNDPQYEKTTPQGVAIDAAGYSVGNEKNYLYETPPLRGDFTFTVKMKYDPTLQYEQGGIYLFEGQNAYLKVDKVNVGNNTYHLELALQLPGKPLQSISIPDTLTAGKEFYLLLTRFNGNYTAYVGLDDANWTYIAAITPTGTPFTADKIGLGAANQKQGAKGFGTALFESAVLVQLTNG